jgi:hypothetical protein
VSNGSSAPSLPGFPGLAEWMRLWLSPSAPQVLMQPILPGWTFAINNTNSSSPQTEAEIVTQQSYGRQLGRTSDVLALLIQDRDDLRDNQLVVDFLAMKEQIDTIKLRAAGDRLEQIRTDLSSLRDSDPGRYEELRSALLRELESPS